MPYYITDDKENSCDDSDREISDEEIFHEKNQVCNVNKNIVLYFFFLYKEMTNNTNYQLTKTQRKTTKRST